MKEEYRNKILQNDKKMQSVIKNLLRSGLEIFEYSPSADFMTIYFQVGKYKILEHYLENLKDNSSIHPEDKWIIEELLTGRLKRRMEVRFLDKNKNIVLRTVDVEPYESDCAEEVSIIGIARDVTKEEKKKKILEEQVKKDSMTGLYNQFYGKELISEYLNNKNPYASCGMMIMDIDYFKSVNDVFGHLFGNKVLKRISDLLATLFEGKDILVRAGGDEFVIFLKDISHRVLVKKAGQLVHAVRGLTFEENEFSMTCSVGVCFLPENVSGFTYEQLFENADWALYRAKENGKNRYEFCDNLKRFELLSNRMPEKTDQNIDARYMRNDIISTAFEVFEKMNSFTAAMELLMKIIGIRFQLDRITVIQTDIQAMNTGRQYQWVSQNAPEVLEVPQSFSKEDFLTLFQSYDEYGTTVLQYDNMSMYSKDAQNLLMQGEAKTVLYAAMYCEGKYTGAISYVVCSEKRYWSKQNRSQLGELTKIISAHLVKSQTLNIIHKSAVEFMEYDSLTGLLSFPKFKEETEKIIVGGYAVSHLMVYIDFNNFKHFNQKYGYETGDQLLKDYCNHVIENLENEQEIYFSRVVADQFVLFMPYQQTSQAIDFLNRINENFLEEQSQRFGDVSLSIRTGVYQIQKGDISASAAIDAANYARNQVKQNGAGTVVLYDREMAQKKNREYEILNRMEMAIKNKEFQVYLQPKFSLTDLSITGAEALVRWIWEDGTMLYPNEFIPLYEKNGKITELDLYIFEEVAAFLKKCKLRKLPCIPVSVNLSLCHTSNAKMVMQYLEILRKYDLDTSAVEIELTETGVISEKEYERIKYMFEAFRKSGFKTVMDDFGSGYSMLNMLIDIPVDTIKLDRVFVNRCKSDDRGVRFLKQLVQMIKKLGYHLVCEGIEVKEQIDILRNIGCEEGQGYWFAKPMDMASFEKKYFFNMAEKIERDRIPVGGSAV